MAIERNKTALEFETMLRRHLKSGGAPVAACAGFDFDAASAYLENALGESHRAGFESHLAGCVTCRRHLIELARLAQTAPHVATQPSTVADRTPAWVRWRGVAAGWFDLSSWNFKWQMAGVAGAALAILIAALGVQSWRQASYENQSVVSVNTAAPASMEVSVPSPTTEPSPQDQSLVAGMESVAAQPTQSQVPVPTPHVGPSVGTIAVPVAPSTESARLNENPQSVTGVFDFNSFQQRQDADASRSNPPLQGRAFQQVTPTQIADSAGGAQSRINPPGINPVNSGPPEIKLRPRAADDEQLPPPESNARKSESEAPGKTPTEKSPSRLRRSLDEILDIINPLPPIKSSIKTESRAFAEEIKPKSKSESLEKAKPKPADDEGPKQLKQRIRDKLFIYQRDVNMWFDQAYKEETMKFRVYLLKRGTKEYEDVLAKEPQLREFFEHGPILIVWKNKVYRVK